MSLPRLVVRVVMLAAGAAVAVVAAREVRRAKPRACEKCASRMRRLGEGEKQAFLEPDEKGEERAGKASHDVWRCPSCAHLEKARWPSIFPSRR